MADYDAVDGVSLARSFSCRFVHRYFPYSLLICLLHVPRSNTKNATSSWIWPKCSVGLHVTTTDVFVLLVDRAALLDDS